MMHKRTVGTVEKAGTPRKFIRMDLMAADLRHALLADHFSVEDTRSEPEADVTFGASVITRSSGEPS